MADEAKKRASNFELLRIIAMIAIVFHHFCVHSPWLTLANNSFNINFFLSNILSLGAVSNIIFVVTTGYFMIKSDINPKKIIGLILEMYFYSILALILVVMFTGHTLTKNELLSTLLPYPCGGNWFCTAYITLYIFIKPLNILIRQLSKKGMKILLIACILVNSILPTLVGYPVMSNLDIFILAYLIGAYIRMYVDREKIETKKLCFYSMFIMFLAITTTLLRYLWDLSKHINIDINRTGYYLIQNKSPFVIALAVFIFLIFSKMKIKNNQHINNAAKTVLGVYLIHDNLLVRQYIWSNYMIDINSSTTVEFIAFGITKVSVIIFICFVIDSLRYKILKKYEDSLSRIIYDKMIMVMRKTLLKG